MATINREFFVDFTQSARFIEYFLPKPDGLLLIIDLFAIGCTPSTATKPETGDRRA
jgi:hypothetical protein